MLMPTRLYIAILGIVSFASLVAGHSGLRGAEWPEFRGPAQNGVVAADGGMPTHWDESTNVRWFVPTQGLGWSSPVVTGDRIYYTTAIQSDNDFQSEGLNSSSDASPLESQDPLSGSQKLCLECRSAKTGELIFLKTIFEQPSDAPVIHKKNSHASPTPIIAGDKLYLHFGHQGTACTDLNGSILWTDTTHSYPPVHGNGGSPILVDDKLILTVDSGNDAYTLALDGATGKEIWRTQRDAGSKQEFSFCTPQLIVINGQKQIVSPGSDIVQSLAPDTGEVIWSLRFKGYSVIPRPLFHNGLVFLSTGYTAPQVLAIDPTGSGDVTETHLRWTAKAAAPNTPSFVPHGNEIIMISDSGIAAAIDTESGKETWKKRIGGNYSASPTLVGDLLYLQSEEGLGYVYDISDKPREIAKNPLPGRTFASYAVVEGDWLIRAEKGLYRIGAN